MTARTFPIVEVFGPTIQGEGRLAGHRSHFVRFAYCDFKCSWCDSAHAVVPRLVQKTPMTVPMIVHSLKALGLSTDCRWVTLTGGNPAMYELVDLVRDLKEADYSVAVETQGSIKAPWLREADLVTLSPKPPSSGQPQVDVRGFLEFMAEHRGRSNNTVLKVVVFDNPDLTYAKEVHALAPTVPFYLSVGTRMGGIDGKFAGGVVDTAEDILDRYRWLAEASLTDSTLRDAVVLPQLHTLIWGQQRGR